MAKRIIQVKGKRHPRPTPKLKKQLEEDFSYLTSKFKNFIEDQLRSNTEIDEILRECLVGGDLVYIENNYLSPHGRGVARGIVYVLSELIASKYGIPPHPQPSQSTPEWEELNQLYEQIEKVVAHILYHSETFKSIIQKRKADLKDYFVDLAERIPKQFEDEVYDELSDLIYG